MTPVIYQFEDVPSETVAAFCGALLNQDKHKGWMSDDDGECHALPDTVIVSVATDEDDAQQDFETQLNNMKVCEELRSVTYSRLSASRLLFSASAIGDGECDWETKRRQPADRRGPITNEERTA